MNDRIPDIYLEQYRIGEASDDVARMIENDEEALMRLQELESDSEAILAAYPPGWFADRIDERIRSREKSGTTSASDGVLLRWLRNGEGFVSSLRERTRRPLWGTLVPLVALTVLGALLIPRLLIDETTPEQIARGERIKGLDERIVLYRSTGDNGAEVLSDGSVVRGGDRLQISYRAAGAPYGTIISVDGWGVVTLHYPEGPDEVGRLSGEGETALPYAYILDDAPSFERFFFITASKPFRSRDIMTAMERLLNQREIGDAATLWERLDDVIDKAAPEDADIYDVTVWKGDGHGER